MAFLIISGSSSLRGHEPLRPIIASQHIDWVLDSRLDYRPTPGGVIQHIEWFEPAPPLSQFPPEYTRNHFRWGIRIHPWDSIIFHNWPIPLQRSAWRQHIFSPLTNRFTRPFLEVIKWAARERAEQLAHAGCLHYFLPPGCHNSHCPTRPRRRTIVPPGLPVARLASTTVVPGAPDTTESAFPALCWDARCAGALTHTEKFLAGYAPTLPPSLDSAVLLVNAIASSSSIANSNL